MSDQHEDRECYDQLAIVREIIPETGLGLPIGSLTSQLFANVYGNQVDRFIHHELKAHHWARYMDDIIILGHDPDTLRDYLTRITDFSESAMKLAISKWQVASVSRGINFLGYRIWPRHKLLRKDSVVRAKRKIRHASAKGDQPGLQRFMTAWAGHARWADTHHLFNHLENHYDIATH